MTFTAEDTCNTEHLIDLRPDPTPICGVVAGPHGFFATAEPGNQNVGPLLGISLTLIILSVLLLTWASNH